MNADRPTPKFDNPPVTEVVVSVQFNPLDAYTVAHPGDFWQHIRADFPRTQTQAPVQPRIEAFPIPLQATVGLELDFSAVPRVWYHRRDDTSLIQLQRDRFMFNWKRSDGTSLPYLGFDNIMPDFRKFWTMFQDYAKNADLGPIEITQCELTYVNNIVRGEGWSSYSDLANVFPDFAWRRDGARFLPGPETFQWRSAFPMSDQLGRLHVTINSAKRTTDGVDVIRWDNTARGSAKFSPDGPPDIWRWFDLAHQWIVFGFEDLTTEKVRREVWKQTR